MKLTKVAKNVKRYVENGAGDKEAMSIIQQTMPHNVSGKIDWKIILGRQMKPHQSDDRQRIRAQGSKPNHPYVS